MSWIGGDAPDYTPVAQASEEAARIAAELGRQQLDEARYQYDNNMAIARPVVETQLGIMRQTAEQGKDYYDYGKTFRPLEQTMLRQAQGQLTPAQIVRLGVSGLNLPSLSGKAQSANVIAGAVPQQGATPTPAPPPQQQQQQQQAPIMRFASASGQSGQRFPNRSMLSALSSGAVAGMLQQQGQDPAAPAPSPASAPVALPPMAARPPAAAPVPSFDPDAFKNDMLAAIDDRLKNIRPPQYSSGFGDGA